MPPSTQPTHRAADLVLLCDRVACQRVPAHAMRERSMGILCGFRVAHLDGKPLAEMVEEAGRIRDGESARQVEMELETQLRYELDVSHVSAPEATEEERIAVTRPYRDALLATAKFIASRLPLPSTATDLSAMPPGAAMVSASTWPSIAAAMCSGGVLTILLRAAGPGGADDPPTFRIPAEHVRAVLRALAQGLTEGFEVDATTSAWAKAALPADEVPAFRARRRSTKAPACPGRTLLHTPGVDPSLLPPNFTAVLRLRHHSRGEHTLSAWKIENPSGIYEGPSLTRAADLCEPETWSAELDGALRSLASVYRGYAPSIFALSGGDKFPHLAAVARKNTALMNTVYARFSDAWDYVGVVAALTYSRLREIETWEPWGRLTCSLCGTEFDGDKLHLKWDVHTYGPPRWCPSCVAHGWGSLLVDAQVALTSIAHYAEVIQAVPTRDWFRQPVPHSLPCPERDRLFAARMAMPNLDALRRLGLTEWGSTLDRAGVLGVNQSTPRGRASRAADGHWCRSLFERAIDDFLSSNGIGHVCEPGWPYHPTLNPSGSRRADWMLDDGTFIEAAGLLGEPAYDAKIKEKQLLAAATGIRLVTVVPEDISRLGILFFDWLDPIPLGGL